MERNVKGYIIPLNTDPVFRSLLVARYSDLCVLEFKILIL